MFLYTLQNYKTIKQVNSFKWLSIHIDYQGYQDEDINTRIQMNVKLNHNVNAKTECP